MLPVLISQLSIPNTKTGIGPGSVYTGFTLYVVYKCVRHYIVV